MALPQNDHGAWYQVENSPTGWGSTSFGTGSVDIDRVKKEGKAIGRPTIWADPVRAQVLREGVTAVQTHQLSCRQAAKQAGVSVTTLQKASKGER
ncbi:MAG: hypothetical protein C7B43_18900 [Sulfobacillus benefaciens]|uniref:Uncharacterized protein n=1 Tax=Sulfobacillus benefaciens TaxID=453960 RepID=A0A2T2WQI1_9FIRM|nr:MAG: hypothetical protein C7B43_18900 [Sulfobacillus benefaciens]